MEYRLAPEHKFPIWLDDGCEIARHVLANKTAFGTVNFLIYHSWLTFWLGGDENTKVGVAGDSAGGLIAASACHTVKNLDFQVEILASKSTLISVLSRF